MPNAGSKKHLKDKNHKVTNALEYARDFAKFNGGKDSATIKAKLLEEAAKKGNPPDIKTANFWSNIAGHLGKLLFVILFLNGCSYIKHPYFNIDDCVKSESHKNLYTGESKVTVLQVTGIGKETYKFKVLKMDEYPNLVGDTMIYDDISFSYFDSTYTKVNCKDVK